MRARDTVSRADGAMPALPVSPIATPPADDSWLFGWDPTPGIVAVWADHGGHALVWQRDGAGVRRSEECFRPWLFAAGLDDLSHLGPALVDAGAAGAADAAFDYRALSGPPGSLRYLLTARDGRALRREILRGAGRRLGATVRHLRELPGAYYAVGPVEQYLMQTGRVYFRGLAYDDLHRLQLDFETTALSPREGRIFLAAVRDSRGLETLLEAPDDGDEAALIADLCALIRARDPDVIENHNLFGFDLPFLEARAAALGVPLAIGRHPDRPLLERYEEPAGWGDGRRARYRVAGRELIDTLDAVRRHAFSARDLPGHGLKAAARYFGVAAPDRTEVPGAETFGVYLDDPARLRRYALDDVAEVDGLSRRLMGAAFALAGMAPRQYGRVAAAGPAMGILEPLLVRAYLRAGAALPRDAAGADGALAPHQGGATTLYAAGVARHVVKADIASMYPSIMRTFRVGSARDPLEALLFLVGRLTDLRLEHRRAALAAAPQSAAAHRHHAAQAAMKIVINSAYGYLGAGPMTLFADRRAADEVTRRGREILGRVVDGLRARGLALIEADTDGVFFAVPEGWTEDEERACVAALAATLPAGIALEYEGRYRAMLSHEVKNYALLTYDGRLIVRGNAFQSSRTEPFGARFLGAALRCALAGDAAGVRRAYLDTVAAVRERRLAPEDVATVARLTKTPEEYARSRAQAREAAYEALLAAGRARWRPGERVRHYRAAGGVAVWLPAADEAPAGAEAGAADRPGGAPPPYDVAHYLAVLHTSYVSRLRKAFAPDDFAQLFRPSGQAGLFDRPLAAITPCWIGA
ncbi:MAG TPA: DNA polymerase domain-containing protein [Thermomicrobiales bacterium]|nr:DNA polymerase domain-containing protein [Thermomicrobiales bacterium]